VNVEAEYHEHSSNGQTSDGQTSGGQTSDRTTSATGREAPLLPRRALDA
jgi:hypothetical protein